MQARNGAFELSGLTPPLLHALDDGTLTVVFAAYRTMRDETGPPATLRFPHGLGDVPDPCTAARRRTIIDIWG
jgi:hypothetical protein